MGRGTNRDNHDFFLSYILADQYIFDYDMVFLPVHLPGHWALGGYVDHQLSYCYMETGPVLF